MNRLNYKHAFYGIGLFLLGSVLTLWSWNTLSALFDLPQAQYKHVLAAFVLLVVMRTVLFPGRAKADWRWAHTSR